MAIDVAEMKLVVTRKTRNSLQEKVQPVLIRICATVHAWLKRRHTQPPTFLPATYHLQKHPSILQHPQRQLSLRPRRPAQRAETKQVASATVTCKLARVLFVRIVTNVEQNPVGGRRVTLTPAFSSSLYLYHTFFCIFSYNVDLSSSPYVFPSTG